VCPIPGVADFSFSGNLLGQPIQVFGNITDGKSDTKDQLDLKLQFQPIQINGRLSPPPLDAFLAQNPQIFVMCSPVVTGAIAGATLVGKVSAFTPFDVAGAIERAIPGDQEESVKILKAITSGIVDQTVTIPDSTLKLEPINAVLGDKEYVLKPVWSSNQIILKY
jgi:hypothetical protein